MVQRIGSGLLGLGCFCLGYPSFDSTWPAWTTANAIIGNLLYAFEFCLMEWVMRKHNAAVVLTTGIMGLGSLLARFVLLFAIWIVHPHGSIVTGFAQYYADYGRTAPTVISLAFGYAFFQTPYFIMRT